jgi:hypothetical protein
MYQTKTTISGYTLNQHTSILKIGAGFKRKNFRAFHESDEAELEFIV